MLGVRDEAVVSIAHSAVAEAGKTPRQYSTRCVNNSSPRNAGVPPPK
jgi:hypothetical protein